MEFNETKFRERPHRRSRAYIQVLEQHRRKLDNKAEELLFVGYSEDTKAYRFLDKETEKIKISRDVKFLDKYSTNEENYQINGCTEEKERKEEQDQLDTIKAIWYSRHDKKDRKTDQSNLKLRRTECKSKGIPAKRFEFAGEVFEINASEPETFEEALSGPDSEKWKTAMDEEIGSLRENNMWAIVDLPEDSKAIGSKWVYTHKKYNANVNIKNYKVRLVTQGLN